MSKSGVLSLTKEAKSTVTGCFQARVKAHQPTGTRTEHRLIVSPQDCGGDFAVGWLFQDHDKTNQFMHSPAPIACSKGRLHDPIKRQATCAVYDTQMYKRGNHALLFCSQAV